MLVATRPGPARLLPDARGHAWPEGALLPAARHGRVLRRRAGYPSRGSVAPPPEPRAPECLPALRRYREHLRRERGERVREARVVRADDGAVAEHGRGAAADARDRDLRLDRLRA